MIRQILHQLDHMDAAGGAGLGDQGRAARLGEFLDGQGHAGSSFGVSKPGGGRDVKPRPPVAG